MRYSQVSMGCPYGNVHAESSIKTIKVEEIHLGEYHTMADVLERITYFNEDAYNVNRLCTSPGHRSPCEFEAVVMLTQNPCQNTLVTPL